MDDFKIENLCFEKLQKMLACELVSVESKYEGIYEEIWKTPIIIISKKDPRMYHEIFQNNIQMVNVDDINCNKKIN